MRCLTQQRTPSTMERALSAHPKTSLGAKNFLGGQLHCFAESWINKGTPGSQSHQLNIMSNCKQNSQQWVTEQIIQASLLSRAGDGVLRWRRAKPGIQMEPLRLCVAPTGLTNGWLATQLSSPPYIRTKFKRLVSLWGQNDLESTAYYFSPADSKFQRLQDKYSRWHGSMSVTRTLKSNSLVWR